MYPCLNLCCHLLFILVLDIWLPFSQNNGFQNLKIMGNYVWLVLRGVIHIHRINTATVSLYSCSFSYTFIFFNFLREGRDIWSRWFCGYRRIMTLFFLNKMCHKTVCGNLCSFRSHRICSLIMNVPFMNTRWRQVLDNINKYMYPKIHRNPCFNLHFILNNFKLINISYSIWQ